MRVKIIALFSVIVLAVAGLGYVLSAAALAKVVAVDPAAASRALGAAVAQLEVEGLAAERWLAGRAADPETAASFSAGTEKAKGEAASGVCNKISEAASKAPELLGIRPSVVLIVGADGKVVGRDGSSLMRGDDLGAAYPSLAASIASGTPMSDVWVSRERNEQMLASYAPVRGADGKLLGALVFGSSLNDERLNAASDKTSGHALVFAARSAKGLDIVARSKQVDEAISGALSGGSTAEMLQKTLDTGRPSEVSGFPDGYVAIARVLDGYGDGKRAVVLAVVKPPTQSAASLLAVPTLGALILGLVLVVLTGVMLAQYLARPIAEIEDGLLAIMNGQTNRRLDIEHAELGGVVFRINSLLNQLFGVAEDDTDEEGRPSRAPTARDFNEALAVDESMVMGGADPAETAALHQEGADAYYDRVFSEYVAGKRSLGDPVDHMVKGEFVARLQTSESELSQKHGKPVRFKVEVKGREVVLIAVASG